MLHQIGAGASGPVFRAFDPESDRLVAVKRFQLDVPPERMHQLVDDLDRVVGAELTHPAIAAPIAAGMAGTAAYLAMEYISGESLDLALREYGAAPPVDALRVAAQLASALDFAAVVGIFHGALHPRDVLLASEDTRMTGLGVASAIERIGMPAPIRRPYTAPERVGGAAWDRRADVFSLAALVYEILYGKRVAGSGDTLAESVAELPGADVVALREVFVRGLANEPDARFGTALEFVEALRAAFPLLAAAAGTAGRTSSRTEPRVRASANGSSRPDAHGGSTRAGSGRLPLDEADVAPPAIPAQSETASPLDSFALADERPEPPVEAPQGPHETSPLEPADVELRSPLEPAYPPLEAAPAFDVAEALRPSPARAGDPLSAAVDRAPAATATQPEFMTSAIERSRSAVWPLALALGIGLAIGFASGYGVGLRDRSLSASPAAASTTAAPTATAPVPGASAARDSTDVAITEGAKPRQPVPAEATPQPEARKPPVAAQATAARPADLKGRLLVRSNPSGARVFVDGHEYGTTPIPVRDLSRGVHRVRVVRDGYATVERRVLLTSSRPALSITVPLARRTVPARSATPGEADSDARPSTPSTVGRFVGALTVESRPSGARVFLDGKLIGTTPLQAPGVRAGAHALMLEHDGYNRWSSAIRIVASETNRVTASLER